jgi:predicted Zn-dependent protease
LLRSSSARTKPRLTPGRLALAVCLCLAPVNFLFAQSTPAMPGSASGSLPTLGDSFDLSAAAERRIGDRIAVSIYRDPDYVDDPVLGDYVQSIWQPLMSAARSRGEISPEIEERFAWEVFLVRDGSINAFALPGGYFGVHLGLISSVNNRDEMAAVLGHELSHVTQRHIARLITQQSRQTPIMIASMLLGALIMSRSPQAGNAAIVGGQAAAAQSQLNFSRDMEREADRVGFGVMTDAGFEGSGVTGLFEKLQGAARLNDNGSFPYLRTHPLTTQRIAEAQSRMQLALASAARPSSQKEADEANANVLHAMMAARARILVAPGVDALRAMVAQAQRQASALKSMASPASTANIRDAGALYGGVLASAQLRDFAGAQNLLGKLQPLTASIPRANQAVALLATELELLAGGAAPSASSATFARAVARAEVLSQASALLAAHHPQEVSERLQTWVTAHPRDAMAWQLLATAYGNQNQTVRAIRAEAESRAAQLDYPAALDRLKAAQALMRGSPASADYVEGSIIDARTRQLELLIKEHAKQDKIDR